MTHLRQIMLEELQRRNYSESTIRAYIRTVEHYSRHFHRSPDQLGPEHIRQYQAAMFREWKLAPNTVTQKLAALRFFYVHSKKEAQQKGDLGGFTLAGHDFRRADFEFRSGPNYHAIICTQVKDYLLQWNVAGLSKNSVQGAVSTIDSMTASPPLPPPEPPRGDQSLGTPTLQPRYIRVSSGLTQGLIIKKVQPVYPQEAKYKHIQGSVHLNAVISKTGDVVDLEVADGPIELVVSAVNAVRQWKYRPYILKGEPVEVQTTKP